jgi:hypothetical protein
MTPGDITADLERRGCTLKHAINLPDLRSYAAHRALLSRAQLTRAGGIRTRFASDESDEQRGLLDRCFGNLSDFGQSFWMFDNKSPNPYGPITLVLKPETFKLCADLAVTRKNAGNASYDLARDRITDEAMWTDLFRESGSCRPARGGVLPRGLHVDKHDPARASRQGYRGTDLHRGSLARAGGP